MNAAARLVHQGVLSRQLVTTHFLSGKQIAVLFLGFAVLFSALSVIYVTHITRIFYANYQKNLVQQNHLHVERGQLLLERSTWMMQARVQQIAEKNLSMVMPDTHSTIVIRE